MSDMPVANCHLCGQPRMLRDSHIWPKFAYKRFAADQSKGGRFADLSKQRLSNDQYTRYWFCDECEQRLGVGETYVSQLCSRIEAKPTAKQAYDETFLRFAASVSWRTLKAFSEDDELAELRNRWPAYTHWQRYLRGSRPGINPYTQHVFIVIDNANGLDKALGGGIVAELSLVLSQIGPLFIVGQLDPTRLTVDEARTWQNSRIRATGGTIRPIAAWKTGTKDPASNNATPKFLGLLAAHEFHTMQALLSGNWKGREKRPPKG